MKRKANAPVADVKSAQRVLRILELLSGASQGLRFAELSERLAYPRSSLHALVATLVHAGWVDYDEATKRYLIGVRAWEVGQGFVHDLALVADSHLRAVSAELGETVQLGVLEGVEVLYIAKVESTRPFGLTSRVGTRLPAWATGLGKVLLASLPIEELRRRMAAVEFTPFTSRTVKNLAELESVLERVRSEGIARDVGELNDLVYCVAAPIIEHTGKVVAAMSCTLPRQADGDARDRQLAEVMVRHAREVSAALGWVQRSFDGGS